MAVIAVAIILVVLLVVIPVGVLMSGGAAAGILGWFLKDDIEEQYEGSELLELDK